MFPIQRSPETASTRAVAAEARRFGRQLVSVFLLLALLLALAGYAYASHQLARARAEAHRELSAIADLKLRQLLNWRAERLSDANFFAHARFVARDLRRFLAEPNSQPARSDLLHWLTLLKNDNRYYAVVVLDPHCKPLLALPPSAAEPAPAVRQLLQRALQSREVVLSDLHRDQPASQVDLDIAFCISEEADTQRGAPLAVVLLKLDAQHFLFPLLRSWPTPSQTAETLLVRREGDQVLFLNDVRHRAATALNLRLPLSTPELPAAKILRGDTNVLEGLDYRGVPVVAAGRLIPGTPWAMVAKVDRREIYAPLHQQMLTAGLILTLLLVAAALLVALLWRRRGAQFLEREVGERRAHEQAMERMNRLYAALSQVNQAVVHARSRDELLQRMCQVLVKFGGFQMAWIGWVDHASARVLPLAQCGDDGYLQKVEIFADDRPAGRGPVGTAIRQGQPTICNDITADPAMQFWREAVAQSGWGAMAAFPIRQESQIRGALTVYSREKNFFGLQEQALLEEAAGDVSFGLDLLLNDQRRRQAEEQLRLQAAALQSAANSIVITDRQGLIQWANTAFERLTGYSLAEAAGQTPRLLTSGRQPTGFFKAMWETILAGQVWQGQLVNKRKDGTLYHEEMTVTPVRNAQGEITHFIAIKQDITERKHAEEALRQARDELARLNADLERKVSERTAQLVEVNASLEAFVHTAAHDLRSPLRSIKSFSSIVLDECAAGLGAEGQSLLHRVAASSEQMSQLLEDLLEYSKLSQAELKLEPVGLQAAVAQVLALLEGDIRAKNAAVTTVQPLPEVLGHPATVVMLINNLVSNALKFMPPGQSPEIRLWAEESGERRVTSGAEHAPCATPPEALPPHASRIAHHTLPDSSQHSAAPSLQQSIHRPIHQSMVRLWVEDNGIGIAEQDREKIFAAFQRLHGKGTYPGTGLGLAIVRKGAERMGGRVGVESESDKGSRFWLELRAVSAKAP